MKHTILIFLFSLLGIQHMQAQDSLAPIFQTLADPKEGKSRMLVGQISKQNIIIDGTCTWLQNGMEAYKPDSTIVANLKPLLKNVTIIACIGTWCEDTQNLFPQFLKAVEAAHMPSQNSEILGMDRNKHALQIEHLLLKVEFVPTIIIRKGPREVARIVETISKKNIETELLSILQKDAEQFKH
jgi:hypothetical protein